MNAKTDYEELAAKYGTPFYLFDFDGLRERVNTIKSRLPQNSALCYAIKANAFFVNALKGQDILFEVCSPGELSICEKEGLNPSKIVFSGVVKTLDDVKRACTMKVHTVTLESLTHCDYLLEAMKENSHEQNVIIRLSSGNQFGMSENDIYTCVDKLKSSPNVKIRGIHFFTGTQKKMRTITDEVSFIQQFCDKLKKDKGIDFTDIEYGPGLSYDYFAAEDQSQNFTDLDTFSALIKDSPYHYVVEMGRFIASPCGCYASRIMDLKGKDKNRYCMIDGGINHINYFGQMMGMKVPQIQHIGQIDAFSNPEDYTVAGSLCTTADIVLRKLQLTAPAIGDLLVFGNIGAYSVTEGIYLFLSHPLPSILAKDGEKTIELRKAQETYMLNSGN